MRCFGKLNPKTSLLSGHYPLDIGNVLELSRRTKCGITLYTQSMHERILRFGALVSIGIITYCNLACAWHIYAPVYSCAICRSNPRCTCRQHRKCAQSSEGRVASEHALRRWRATPGSPAGASRRLCSRPRQSPHTHAYELCAPMPTMPDGCLGASPSYRRPSIDRTD